MKPALFLVAFLLGWWLAGCASTPPSVPECDGRVLSAQEMLACRERYAPQQNYFQNYEPGYMQR